MLGGSALSLISHRGADYPLSALCHLFSSADITVANLEAPFSKDGQPFDKTYTYQVPSVFAGDVKASGIDVLTLANNHILDFGPAGLETTLLVLDSLGLAHCGAGKDWTEAEKEAVVSVGPWRVAFLAFSMTFPDAFWAADDKPGTAYPHPERMRACLQSLRQKVDRIVVSFHWGAELTEVPKPYQRDFAHRAIDWGADLVIGHHPHVLQGLELYRDRLIAYSLGNFVFGSYSRKARDAALLKVRFDKLGMLYAEVIPICVDNLRINFQPILYQGVERDNVLQHLNYLSTEFNNGRCIIRADGLIVPNSAFLPVQSGGAPVMPDQSDGVSQKN